MARITVEDCLRKVDNRFRLIHLAAKRVRQLRKGAEPLYVCKNKDVVVSLREIAAGKVFPVENGEVDQFIEDSVNSIPFEVLGKTEGDSIGEEETVQDKEID
jgi:DNA-directed RNA polymerase subunit omega